MALAANSASSAARLLGFRSRNCFARARSCAGVRRQHELVAGFKKLSTAVDSFAQSSPAPRRARAIRSATAVSELRVIALIYRVPCGKARLRGRPSSP